MYGEFFTPEECVDRVLEQLPNHLWFDEHLKWLEPSCGRGIFTERVFHRLFQSLKNKISDDNERHNHIMNNMLFLVDIRQENVNKCREVFTNVYCTDFITWIPPSSISFDIVIGNPPFATSDYPSVGKNRLFERFISKCIDKLHVKVLVFITPTNLFSGNTSTAYNLIYKHTNTITFLSKEECQKYFPSVDQPMCYFMYMQRNINIDNYKHITYIRNQSSILLQTILKNRPLNPVSNWTVEIDQFLDKCISCQKGDGIYNRGVSLNNYKQENEAEVPVLYTPKNKLSIERNHKLCVGLGQPKFAIYVIGPEFKWFRDNTGEYAIGPNMCYLPYNNTETGNQIEQFFISDIFKQTVQATRTTRKFLKIAIICYLNLHNIVTDNENNPISTQINN